MQPASAKKQCSNNNYLIILFGPTGVGKTDFALSLAQHLPAEIINADVGQFYLPLSIGTAKPDWQNQSVPHHLFDICGTPTDVTVTQYRTHVLEIAHRMWGEQKIPIIVGGSGFYIASLFFPPVGDVVSVEQKKRYDTVSSQALWEQLKIIDPERATQIHPHDTYRIIRALGIWKATGIKPSEYKPVYEPPCAFGLYFLTRDRADLYERINQRVASMIEHGWVEEVQALQSTEWESFLLEKKLIGYDDIFQYLKNGTCENKAALIQLIAKKTRNYAKRQMTFWRMLETRLRENMNDDPCSYLKTLNLSHFNYDRDMKSLVKNIQKLILR